MRMSWPLIILVRAELAFEAEIRVVKKDTGVKEAWTADRQLMKRSPTAGWGGGRGEKVGGNGGYGFGTFKLQAGITNQRRESGADTSKTCPASEILFELRKYI